MSDGISHISAFQILLMGGPLMWPLLACSIAAVTITVERFLYFRSISVDGDRQLKSIREALQSQNIKKAFQLCDSTPSPWTEICRSGLLKSGQGREEIVNALEQASRFQVPLLERGLALLSTVGQVSLLLGLLGTVIGLGQSFYQIQMRSAGMETVTLVDISGGVWSSLLTTAVGLSISVLVLLSYNYFIFQARAYVREMERWGLDLVEILLEPQKSGPEE